MPLSDEHHLERRSIIRMKIPSTQKGISVTLSCWHTLIWNIKPDSHVTVVCPVCCDLYTKTVRDRYGLQVDEEVPTEPEVDPTLQNSLSEPSDWRGQSF